MRYLFKNIVFRSKSEDIALDSVRAVAVLLVVMSHTNFIGMGGQGGAGVYLFFCLSGFLLSTPFINDVNNIISVQYLKIYYLRRIFRILPMYYLLLMILFLVGFIDENQLFNSLLFKDGIGHFWSIPQEMLFYLFLPIIFLPMYFIAFCRNQNTIKYVYLIFIIVIFALYMNIKLYGNGKYSIWYGYLFIMGIITRKVSIECRDIFTKNTFIFNMVLTLCLFIYFTSARQILQLITHHDYGYIAWSHSIIFGIMSCIFILSVIFSSDSFLLKVLLTSKEIQLIGILGYSIYLLHWFVLGFINHYFDINSTSKFVIVLGVSIVLSLFSFCYIECPFINYSHKKTQK